VPPAAAAIDPEIAQLVADGLGSLPGALLRLPPALDLAAVAEAVAAKMGPTLVLSPSHSGGLAVVRRLERGRLPVAWLPREWAKARAGGCSVVGARAGAWAPLPDARAIVVLDGHDEGYQEERAPTWHAVDVAIERARRARIPCLVATPCPDLSLLTWRSPLVPTRRFEREGWPIVDVLDRRGDDPRTGLYGEKLVELVRRAERAVCVLNRKGRARLLACGSCGEVARCASCGAAVGDGGEGLACSRCGATRPRVCALCGSTRLKTLRVGVTRAREELEAILQRPVGEVTGDSDDLPTSRVVIGTEAVLHRASSADLVAFLDFDQELLAPRYRAGEQALALLARAGRLVGGRRDRGGRVAVQTRSPSHEVIQAALHGDPARVADAERQRRSVLRFPPETALAAVSGPQAGELIERLATGSGVEIVGPSDGRWLLRAADHATLADALAGAGRPPGRLRVEVDPRRL
jgi:primosomal protein N' (replication factor Y)